MKVASSQLIPINAHHVMTMLLELSEQWLPEGKQKIIAALTTCPLFFVYSCYKYRVVCRELVCSLPCMLVVEPL